MTDVMSYNGNFKRSKGWGDERRQRLLTDLFNVLGHFRNRGLDAYSCTVVYSAHRQAKTHLPNLRAPEAMCVDFCVGGLQLTDEQLISEPRPILLYFDRKEQFLRHVKETWTQGQREAKSRKAGWPWQVRNIIPADRSEYYPIQAADMLGWIISRCRKNALATSAEQPEPRLVFTAELDEYEVLFQSA